MYVCVFMCLLTRNHTLIHLRGGGEKDREKERGRENGSANGNVLYSDEISPNP